MTDTRTSPGEPTIPLERLLTGERGWLARHRRWLLPALLLIVLGVAAWVLIARGQRAAAPRYRTEPATVGTLVVTVSATGSLQPTNQVDVGSELSGIVEEVHVDDNDEVTEGQLLAVLDLSKLEDAATRSRANLAAAEAQVLEAHATVAEARAKLERFRRVAELSGGKVPSKTEMETAEATLARARAAVANAQAAVAQARAQLESNLTDIDKAHIRSPIDGVVLSRQVDPGQTVAATFQAPVLFTLAEDLSMMELQVDVDEADVGQVEQGQAATFTVDAWPGRRFDAVVTRVGYGSQVKEGVVSYPAVLEVDNEDLSLRPGMTGTAEITTLIRDGALLVPNQALRWSPAEDTEGESRGRGVVGILLPRPPRPERRANRAAPSEEGAARVWVVREGEPVPVPVETGATDGRVTEIAGGEVEPGTEVITETMSTEP